MGQTDKEMLRMQSRIFQPTQGHMLWDRGDRPGGHVTHVVGSWESAPGRGLVVVAVAAAVVVVVVAVVVQQSSQLTL